MAICVRERLLSIVNDIELISKEMFESMLTPKQQRRLPFDHAQMAELLVAKDRELRAALRDALTQEHIQSRFDALRADVDRQDETIIQLQRHLKDTEHVLATALYQAKQKLGTIGKANDRPISSEELIKYSHRISASHAVAAPYNWELGDPRRPYPTDIEMRSGLLGQNPDLAGTAGGQTPVPAAGAQFAGGTAGGQTTPQHSGSGSDVQLPMAAGGAGGEWQDVKPNLSSLNSAMPSAGARAADAKEHAVDMDSVEIMSDASDSSSSSSSDSQ